MGYTPSPLVGEAWGEGNTPTLPPPIQGEEEKQAFTLIKFI
jgi:hypothetical protein